MALLNGQRGEDIMDDMYWILRTHNTAPYERDDRVKENQENKENREYVTADECSLVSIHRNEHEVARLMILTSFV